MKLICPNKHEWLVHSGHYWRYRAGKISNCPECGEKGKPDKSGKRHLVSRNAEVKRLRNE